jgi:[ribosomal protein S5]-alanine N-acetyltransferase
MPKNLKTNRLTVVSATPSLASACSQYAIRNREHHKPWSPSRDEEYFTSEHWERRLSEAAQAFESESGYGFLLLDPEDHARVIGEVNYSNIVRGAFWACYLGYALDRDAVGRGYMLEALQATLAFIFSEVKLHRVMANYMPANERSGRLLQSLGFDVEGFARDYLYLDGAWRDHVLTALHADRFRAS